MNIQKMNKQILIYSQYSKESMKLFQVFKKYNIDTSHMSLLKVDNEVIRKKILNDKRLNIRYVPTLIFVKDSKKGVIEKYVGFDKISQLIEIPVQQSPQPVQPPPQPVQPPPQPVQPPPQPVQPPPQPVQQPPQPVQPPPQPVQPPPQPVQYTQQPVEQPPQQVQSEQSIPSPSPQTITSSPPETMQDNLAESQSSQPSINPDVMSREMPNEMNSTSLQSNINVSNNITTEKKESNLPVKNKNPVSDLATKMRQEREALDNEISKTNKP